LGLSIVKKCLSYYWCSNFESGKRWDSSNFELSQRRP
jgi:hypothetical protein